MKKNLKCIEDAVLIHMWHVAFDLLCEAQWNNKYCKIRCEERLFNIVGELDRRGL